MQWFYLLEKKESATNHQNVIVFRFIFECVNEIMVSLNYVEVITGIRFVFKITLQAQVYLIFIICNVYPIMMQV